MVEIRASVERGFLHVCGRQGTSASRTYKIIYQLTTVATVAVSTANTIKVAPHGPRSRLHNPHNPSGRFQHPFAIMVASGLDTLDALTPRPAKLN
jgi:hypothetical protein